MLAVQYRQIANGALCAQNGVLLAVRVDLNEMMYNLKLISGFCSVILICHSAALNSKLHQEGYGK